MVGVTERHTLADEPIGEVGGEERGIGSGGEAAGLVELRARERGVGDGNGKDELVSGIEERRLVVLQVAIIGERQAFREREQVRERSLEARGLAPQELHRIRITLLGHQRRTRREFVGHAREAEFRGGPEDHVLG